jgi:lysozyme
MHTGIDVSGFQGQPDFRKVADAGHRFVYIKATEGVNFTDHGFKVRQQNARQANLHTGFYHFLRPQAGRNGAMEADHFYETVRGIKRGPGRGAKLLRLAADIEVTATTPPITREYARDFLTRLKHLAGHEPMLYTFPGFMSEWGSELTSYPLWLANFTTGRPALPHGFTHWTIWQHADHGHCPGVGGEVDLNRCPRLAPILLDRPSY